MELRELSAFVAVVEGSSTGTHPTEAGLTLLAEARAVLARYQQAERTMARLTGGGEGILRLGIPWPLRCAPTRVDGTGRRVS